MKNPVAPWSSASSAAPGTFCSSATSTGGIHPFPKATSRPGETERQTAEREILEETGVRVRVDTGFRAENRYMARPDVEKLVVFFIAVAEEQTPVAQQGEVAVAEWVEVNEAAVRLTYEQDRRILRRARKYLFKEKDAD